MGMQYSSKDEKNCVRCDNVIYRSEKRRTDGGMHSHFTCPTKTDGIIKIVIMPNLEHLRVKRKDEMDLTKLQLKTIKMIGRWVDGHCTHSKAKVTNKQLEEMGILTSKCGAVVLTELGRNIYNKLNK